ncbi:MAG: hypothetical protein A2080_08875 [Ignavibacteria bacterium GWC2_36_12]|nr:MAG: hypothetical protein A2328_00070 [Bdellovibrionales bacterium RIFOXYB2_FULL_36_6]OGU51022.1 MAG: hypothetical protein A2080_08875 [Ignavibacteria bacterium GWC2_36_12]
MNNGTFHIALPGIRNDKRKYLLQIIDYKSLIVKKMLFSTGAICGIYFRITLWNQVLFFE